LRTLASVAFILVALTGILGLSISSALVEQERLLDQFAQSTRDQAHASAEALSRVDSIDKDTHMLVHLVEQSRSNREADLAIERRIWFSAFRALALVVPPYRLLALVEPDGSVEVLAVDPTELPPTVATLLPGVRRLGADVSIEHRGAVGQATRVGTRSFLSYAMPVRGGGAIVVVSDAAVFLRDVAWAPLMAARLFVTDPAGAVWTGCATAAGCRATDDNPGQRHLGPGISVVSKLGPDDAERLGLGRGPAVLASEIVNRPAGSWTITWVASNAVFSKREQSLLARIVLTAVAAAAVVVGVGTVILRQQRRAVALGGQLRYAEALASARDLENQLVRAEKLITVGVMSTEIAHEIGSPLAVIRGRAEQVLRETSQGPRSDDLRVIIKHVDNISSTIRQLLDFSRRQPIERHPVSLELIVERARDLLTWKLDTKRLRLKIALDGDLPPMAADADQLQQVLVNLLLNAADASQPGAEVEIAGHASGDGMVRLEIRDHGAGIQPEHMQAVFEPFFTTKQRGEGTGLGLPIATSIVRNHSGHIDLDSALGEGTTVTILWPSAVAAQRNDV
jgi:signal transduction histidine kinase